MSIQVLLATIARISLQNAGGERMTILSGIPAKYGTVALDYLRPISWVTLSVVSVSAWAICFKLLNLFMIFPFDRSTLNMSFDYLRWLEVVKYLSCRGFSLYLQHIK